MSAYSRPIPGYEPGSLYPHPDGGVAVRKPNGYTLCMTPDGDLEERPNDGSNPVTYVPGAWEKFEQHGAALLAVRDKGREVVTYVLSFVG